MFRPGRITELIFEDSLRTAVAGVLSFILARALKMPEAYWATFSTLIVTQSSLGAAANTSWQRLGGTVLGAGLGGILATFFPNDLFAFGVGVFALGILCAFLRIDLAYRFAAVTLSVIMLIPRDHAAWMIALHRLIEVAVGIAVGLVCTALWPRATLLHRREVAAAEGQKT